MAYLRERNRGGGSRIGASHSQISVKQGAKDDLNPKRLQIFLGFWKVVRLAVKKQQPERTKVQNLKIESRERKTVKQKK